MNFNFNKVQFLSYRVLCSNSPLCSYSPPHWRSTSRETSFTTFSQYVNNQPKYLQRWYRLCRIGFDWCRLCQSVSEPLFSVHLMIFRHLTRTQMLPNPSIPTFHHRADLAPGSNPTGSSISAIQSPYNSSPSRCWNGTSICRLCFLQTDFVHPWVTSAQSESGVDYSRSQIAWIISCGFKIF